MLKFINNYQLKTKLFFILLLPLTGLLFFATLEVYDKYLVVDEMGRLTELVDFGDPVRQLVHEIQVERGLTAGFLGSKGKKMAGLLRKQRPSVDDAFAAFKQAAGKENLQVYDRLIAIASGIEKDLVRLPKIRKQVDSLKIKTKAVLGYYVKLNTRLLDLFSEIRYAIKDTTAGRRLNATLALLQYKEHAGIERAVLANAFARNKFTGDLFVRFANLVNTQAIYTRQFEQVATRSQKKIYRGGLDEQVLKSVNGFEKIAFAKYKNGGFGLAPEVWFKVMTKKIEMLHAIEVALVADLVNYTKASHDSSQTSLLINSGFVVIILLISIILAAWISRNLSNRIGDTATEIKSISEGNLTTRLEKTGRDEISIMADGINTMTGRMQTLIRQIVEAAGSLDASSKWLSASSNTLSSSTHETSAQAGAISSAAEEMNSSLQTIAAAVKQMSASIAEVANNSSTASDMAGSAAATVAKTNELVTRLDEDAQSVGSIIETISDIAIQTKQLALNASIEAANAGAAGKGFAIVASEVKDLALQSAEASEQIKAKITGIQARTDETTGSVREFTELVGGLNNVFQTIAAAVHQQSVNAKELSSGVSQTTDASREVAQNINGIATAAKQGAIEAGESSEKARELESLSGELRELIGGFRV